MLLHDQLLPCQSLCKYFWGWRRTQIYKTNSQFKAQRISKKPQRTEQQYYSGHRWPRTIRSTSLWASRPIQMSYKYFIWMLWNWYQTSQGNDKMFKREIRLKLTNNCSFIRNYSFTNIWYTHVFLLLGCGRNITGELDGILHSPNFPEKYASSAQENITQQCHWFIHVKPGHKVLLYFEEFEVEGKPEGKFNLLEFA